MMEGAEIAPVFLFAVFAYMAILLMKLEESDSERRLEGRTRSSPVYSDPIRTESVTKHQDSLNTDVPVVPHSHHSLVVSFLFTSLHYF